jgi:uncharacterized membrane protein
MVKTWRSADESRVCILARGNFSLNATGMFNLLLALSLVTLFLAAVLAWQGYWPILVIAVLQILLVGGILLRAWKQAWVSEEFDISADRIRVTCRRSRNERQYELDPAWTLVELKQPQVAWYGPRVILRSGARQREVGAFLTVEEKHQLLRQLQSALIEHSAMKGAFNV